MHEGDGWVVEGSVAGQMTREMDGWMDRQTDGRVGRWMEG